MRHFLLSRPVAAHSGGMKLPPTLARLMSLASRLQGPPPCPPSASAVAVDLPPIAAAADDDLLAATGAQEQTARNSLGIAAAT
jgi:hypothetical protein